MPELWLFISLTFFVSASPGPAMLTCLADGARFGLRHTVFTMLGISCGNLILICLSALGLSFLLSAYPAAFSAVKYFGAAYLAWLGLRLAFSGIDNIDLATIKVHRHKLFAKAMLIALGNPKGLIYFGALFPQFIDPAKPALGQLIVLSSLCISIDMLWMSIYAGGGKLLLKWLQTPVFRRIFNISCGSALLVAAVFLSLSNIS
ncbi:LysE family translocator [Agaribacterium haliotis]|uniref:LysE family translocator n=1 Tax=Agaribacterium haliotis TaxID=2013869 RepID=UPI000BB5569B|nr:LysE family translocator [Agaribacterium haliotis]